MIAALLLRLGISPIRAIFYGLAVVALLAALLSAKHSYDTGIENKITAQWQKRESDADIAASAALAKKDANIRAAQTKLDAAILDASKARQGLENAQAKSTALENDLLASRKRMSIATVARAPDRGAVAPGGGAASVGGGAEIIADIAPRAAGSIERLRGRENQAIARLNACVDAYAAVKKAADEINAN